ncbi:MAG: ammonia-forming cytochrome c nitrite reductase subunit c552 [Planctomycetes bacterium]|nr:ammonia-forming cytochrome c nitrite reductase subunit c552 [Planctomycetota bacterium]
MSSSTSHPSPQPAHRRSWVGYIIAVVITALLTVVVLGLLVSIFERKQEAQQPFVRLVEVTEDTIDPATWGVNWPRQYDSYRRTVDYTKTRYGGSDAIPAQKLDQEPWLRTMYSGYAFALDYREARGHAYMLLDQQQTERVLKRPQPGACLHCHASVLPIYRSVGSGDVMEGFRKVNAMPYTEARQLKDIQGQLLVQHPVGCIDCHDPQTLALRVTRPGFLNGIRELKAHEGVSDYDVNRDATRQEMRTYVCAQCHVEYYFRGPEKMLTYPWSKGIQVQEIETYYEEQQFTDWTHGITGAKVLKAQHPEFELWSQGIHARSGVACADCHMPYRREGAMKVSDHHVRSPLLSIDRSCQVCHNIPEDQLLARAHNIQDKTHGLINRSADALVAMINALAAARAGGASDEQMQPLWKLHRAAQWRLDFVSSENSVGFHASQETARILAEAIDYARQGEIEAVKLRASPPAQPAQPPAPVEGVTPTKEAPPGPHEPGSPSN